MERRVGGATRNPSLSPTVVQRDRREPYGVRQRETRVEPHDYGERKAREPERDERQKRVERRPIRPREIGRNFSQAEKRRHAAHVHRDRAQRRERDQLVRPPRDEREGADRAGYDERALRRAPLR